MPCLVDSSRYGRAYECRAPFATTAVAAAHAVG